MPLALQIGADQEDLPAILRDVRVLAQRGSFPTAARRFGELRLEDGRHQMLEAATVEALGQEHAAARERLAASRAQLLRLESACATALERCACAEYEAAADALEQALRAHAALEQSLNRRLQHGSQQAPGARGAPPTSASSPPRHRR